MAYHGQRSRRIGGPRRLAADHSATGCNSRPRASEPEVPRNPRPSALAPTAPAAVMMNSHGYRPTETVEELTRAQCLELIATVPVGRIGVSIRALPVILPVNFVLVGESIVFRTIPGTKLDAATANAVVAFEVDSYAPDGTSGWSVLIQGVSSLITDPADLLALADISLRAWAFDGGVATRLVRIESSFIRGRRFCHRQM